MHKFYSSLESVSPIEIPKIPQEIITLNIQSKSEVETLFRTSVSREQIEKRLIKLHFAMKICHTFNSFSRKRNIYEINAFEKNISSKNSVSLKDSDSFIFV